VATGRVGQAGIAEVAMEGIHEPLPRQVHDLLRRAVLDLAVSERRRSFPTLLHVGDPGGSQAVFALTVGDTVDHTLRTDVVAALLRRTALAGLEPVVWLTRPGDLDLQDEDAAWLAAARAATGEAGVGLTMVVVTRKGWRDPRSGVQRTWKRLRPG
jgi:hypothetical protein